MTVQQVPKNVLGWLGFIVSALTLYAFMYQASLQREDEFRELVTQQINIITAKFSEVTNVITAVTEHIKAHDKKAEKHIEDIEWNRLKIIDLMTNANARRDPFTGTQGHALEKRMENIERMLLIELKQDALLHDEQSKNETGVAAGQ